MPRPCDIIRKKRDGHQLTKDDITSFFSGVINGDVPDYQVTAFLMAVLLKGMTAEETFYLTEVMIGSGTVFDLSDVTGPKVDKHSTGGVGDKVSLILAPLVASAGVIVPMISGRGLGIQAVHWIRWRVSPGSGQRSKIRNSGRSYKRTVVQ